MYEMRPGPNQPGTAVVWHVTAKQAVLALCGQQLAERVDVLRDEQATHCPPCMDSFVRLVTTKPG
ncbi:hypothetical protein [Streptomyces sp. AK04-3B]|uniref:hypothetical protein n=1 Tax=Streptomyces sp. AK04-3B TaxID=3028650 RepID=UPI0029A8F868|nr:hypothetical protein [Streptomyces sp. AK04-3B]MDX3803651.1 hypothetical protein [Streptomyces sp. AK04-3B]